MGEVRFTSLFRSVGSVSGLGSTGDWFISVHLFGYTRVLFLVGQLGTLVLFYLTKRKFGYVNPTKQCVVIYDYVDHEISRDQEKILEQKS